MAHLFVAVSGHGLGHLGQVSPVVEELARRVPGLRLTVQSALPARRIGSRIATPFELISDAPDIGMHMDGPLTTLAEASLRAYRAFHATWDRRVEQHIALYERLHPDLVLADVPYLPLEAARRAGIPAAALCSLNWAGILAAYCRGATALRIARVMIDAYRSAQVFIRPVPAMPMPELPNTRAVGPIAALGTDRRPAIADRLGLAEGVRLALASFGGIDVNIETLWPPLPDTHWILPVEWGVRRRDCHTIEALGLPFTDLLRSVDLVVTKPGYATFTEAACNGTAVVYAARPDWPESACLEDWLHAHGRARRLSLEHLLGGGLGAVVSALLDEPLKPVPEPAGTAEAAALLAVYLGERRNRRPAGA